MHHQEEFPHAVGCGLSVVTLGLFIPLWILVTWFDKGRRPWTCQTCGTSDVTKSKRTSKEPRKGPFFIGLNARGCVTSILALTALAWFGTRDRAPSTTRETSRPAEAGADSNKPPPASRLTEAELLERLRHQLAVVDPPEAIFIRSACAVNGDIASIVVGNYWYDLPKSQQLDTVRAMTNLWQGICGKDGPSWFLYDRSGKKLGGWSAWKGTYYLEDD